MITVFVCAAVAAVGVGSLAVGLWRDYVATQMLIDELAWDQHVAEACDLATDPDFEHFRQWEREWSA